MSIEVRTEQGKEQWKGVCTSLCIQTWSCNEAIWFPRVTHIALHTKPLNFMPVRHECYHTLSKPKHLSTSTPHKFFFPFCRANLREWIKQFRVIPVKLRCIFPPTDAARKTVVRQAYYWLLATAEEADIKIVPASLFSVLGLSCGKEKA